MGVNKIRGYRSQCVDCPPCPYFKYICGMHDRRFHTMACLFPAYHLPAARRFPVAILALSWVCGLLAGTYIAFSADDSFSALMRPVLSSPVSIVTLLIVHFLPLFFSAFVMMVFPRWMLYLLPAGEAFLFSYVASGVVLSFGSSGWLPALLLLLSNGLCSSLMLWFWICVCQHPVSGVWRQFLLTASLIIAISIFDYCFLLPFSLDLFRI